MRTTTRTFSAPLALTSHPTPPHTARGLHCGLQSNPENNSVQVTRNLSAQETQNSSVQPAQNSSVQPTSTDTEQVYNRQFARLLPVINHWFGGAPIYHP